MLTCKKNIINTWRTISSTIQWIINDNEQSKNKGVNINIQVIKIKIQIPSDTEYNISYKFIHSIKTNEITCAIYMP
jgi:hypothetical protein